MDVKLEIHAISKSFPGVKALHKVDFNLFPGEVHALCGENGAGKTTLMNILSGNIQPDEGQIFLDGQRVLIANQSEAHGLGIGIVYQEKSLIDGLSVADNVFAGHQPANQFGFIARQKLYRQTKLLLNQLGINVEPKRVLRDLSPGKQQMVEVAKALALDPDILILDEPTASTSARDAEILFQLIRQFTNSGKSVIYISHRLPELFVISDRVTILKDGVSQGTYRTAELGMDEVIRRMVGRDLKSVGYTDDRTKEIRLQTENFSGKGFQEISLTMVAGEILGLSGLVGAGRTEFARAVFAIDEKSSGELQLSQQKVSIRSSHQAIRAGLGYLPEDRKNLGLFLGMSIEKNIRCIHENILKGSDTKRTRDQIKLIAHNLNIRAPSLDQKVIHLSGGNQQKVILARWLLIEPKILMIDEPTAGIDVGTKSEIYRLLKQLTKQGKSILLISSDLPELISICDRIIVFKSGETSAEFERPEFNEEEIMHHAAGTKISSK